MADSKDAIDAAIQSAESLFASLLDRVSSSASLSVVPGESLLATTTPSVEVGVNSTDSVSV